MAQIMTILVCLDYHDVRWELPIEVAAGLCRCLVAWQVNPPPVDGGVPEGVAKVMASTLVSQALVTFPTRTRNLGISFVHASHAGDMQQAFDAEYFIWSQRGQVIFLSPAQAPPPTLSEKHFHLATNGDSLHKLADTGVTGVVLPGVDGDVAGIYTFTSQLLKELLTGLRAACDRIGAQFQEVTEAELSEALASE
jgi:hypothetical protein